MVDTIPDDELNEIYDRKQTRMVSDTDKRDDRAITEWLTRGVPEKVKGGTPSLAKALAEPEVIRNDIETTTDIEKLPKEEEIDRLRVERPKSRLKDDLKDKASELAIPSIRGLDTIEEMVDVIKIAPKSIKPSLRREAKFRIRFLIRQDRLPEDSELPMIR